MSQAISGMDSKIKIASADELNPLIQQFQTIKMIDILIISWNIKK